MLDKLHQSLKETGGTVSFRDMVPDTEHVIKIKGYQCSTCQKHTFRHKGNYILICSFCGKETEVEKPQLASWQYLVKIT